VHLRLFTKSQDLCHGLHTSNDERNLQLSAESRPRCALTAVTPLREILRPSQEIPNYARR